MISMVDLSTSVTTSSFGPGDLPAGESRRVYLKYKSHVETQVREGVIIDPNFSKKGSLSDRPPAFKMKVTRRGIIEDGEVKLEDVLYTNYFFYKDLRKIGLI